MQEVKRLTPDQVAITLDDESFKVRLTKQLSPKLLAEGFKVDAVELGYNGNEERVWLIMLKKGDGPPPFPRGPEWDRMKVAAQAKGM